MRNLFRFVFVWLVMSGMVQVAWSATAADAFFDTSLGDYAAELKTAQQQGKLGVLLVFEAEGCPFCKRMRAQVLNQPEVQQYFRRYFNVFSVDLNGSVAVTDFSGKEQAEKAFARALKVRGTPSFVFIGVNGHEVARYVGATRDAETFLDLGRYVAGGHWQKMTFEQFRSAK